MVWDVSIPDCLLGIVIGTFGTLAIQDFIKGVKRNHSVLKFVRSWFSEDTKKVEPTPHRFNLHGNLYGANSITFIGRKKEAS